MPLRVSTGGLLLLFAAVPSWLATASSVGAASVQFVVKDASGAPFSEVLVIAKSLSNGKEVLRTLTNKDGKTSSVDLTTGSYRAIATFPYGSWKTEIKEFVVPQDYPITLTLTMQVEGTEDDVAFVGAPTRVVRVLDSARNPVSGALVIVRNDEATQEKRYSTNRAGEVDVQLISNPSTVVAVTDHGVAARIVTDERSSAKIIVEVP